MLIKVSQNTRIPLGISENIINNIWNYEKHHKHFLYEGEIFCINSLNVNEIIGNFISYKYSYVQNIIGDLGIRTLAVSAAVKCLDGFILVKRSQHVTQDRGLWEFSISGGIEKFSTVNGIVEPDIQI